VTLTPIAVRLAIVSSFIFASSLPAYPHGGGLDAYGCHYNRKAGGYHCHRGPLAGEAFSSKEEMLKKLSEGKADSKGVKAGR
jgi:hypothetical protein